MDTTKKGGIYENGEWKVNRLKFLTEFMRQTCNTTSSIAKKVGVGRQAIYNYLLRDDMSLKMVHQIMDSCGCKIMFSLEKPEEENGNLVIRLNNYFMRNLPEGIRIGRLSFLSIAMQRYGITGKDLSEKLHIARSTISTWFVTDNVMISHIYNICEAYGMELKVTITDKDESDI